MFKSLLLIVLIFTTSLIADDVIWAKSFKDGIKEATAKNKPVLFISSRHSCKYCVILEETTLKDTKVSTALNRDFISIVSYSDEGDYMPKELWRPSTPSIWFLLPNGQPMFQPIPGAIGVTDFLKALYIVKTKFDESQKKIKFQGKI